MPRPRGASFGSFQIATVTLRSHIQLAEFHTRAKSRSIGSLNQMTQQQPFGFTMIRATRRLLPPHLLTKFYRGNSRRGLLDRSSGACSARLLPAESFDTWRSDCFPEKTLIYARLPKTHIAPALKVSSRRTPPVFRCT